MELRMEPRRSLSVMELHKGYNFCLGAAGGFYLLSCHADGAPHNREDVVLADDEPFNR